MPIRSRRRWRIFRLAALLLVTINPVLELRVPPLEFFAAITRSGLPSFECCTFVFTDDIEASG